MRSATMDEHHRRLVSRAPDAQMYAATVDVDVTMIRFLIERCGEPGWCNRHLARAGKQLSDLRGFKLFVLIQLPLAAADSGMPVREMWNSRIRFGQAHHNGDRSLFVPPGDGVPGA